jgi:hypothetical protein
LADEKARLMQALAERERVAVFFNNLEKLNSSEEIDPQLYNSKREEYTRRLGALSLEISHVKADIQMRLDEAGRTLSARKLELATLDLAYKVGELPAAKYQGPAAKLRAGIAGLERDLADLEMCGQANALTDIAAVRPVLPAAPASAVTQVGPALRVFYRTKVMPAIRDLQARAHTAVTGLRAAAQITAAAVERQPGDALPSTDFESMLENAAAAIERTFRQTVARLALLTAPKRAEGSPAPTQTTASPELVTSFSGPSVASPPPQAPELPTILYMPAASSQADPAVSAETIITPAKPSVASARMKAAVIHPLYAAGAWFPNIPMVEFALPNAAPAVSRFSLVMEPLSAIRAAALIVSLLMFVAVLLLPWVMFPGFGLRIVDIDFWISAGCILLLLIYASATFIFNRKTRSLAHIAAALLFLPLWLTFRLVIFPPLVEFAISRSDMEGAGLSVMLAAIILGTGVGIMEMFPSVDAQSK